MPVKFECITELALSPFISFDLSRSVDAHIASMAQSGERAIGHSASGLLGLGEEITWRAWHFGVPWELTSRITAFDPPLRFVDEQIRGPFHSFRHEHLFESVGGGTRMTDIVEFEAPGGWLGRLAERPVLGPYVHNLIDQRNAYLKQP
jgi:ligand-binding SRPBCC domain-containing protein